MNQTAAVWLLILLAFIAANVPFLNHRVFAVWQPKSLPVPKAFWLRAFELFVVMAFPGFVFRYLLRRA